MRKLHYTHDQLKELAAEYFTSNPDVDYLIASSHDGVFYRPENAGYAQANAVAGGGELVKVLRDATAAAVAVTSPTMNINIQNLSVHTLGHVDDLPGFLRGYLTRVANGEAVDTVLPEMLAGVPETLELTVGDLPEHDDQSGLAEAIAGALHLPGFLVPAGNLSDAPEPIAPTQAAPTSTEAAPAQVAPAPKKPRATTATKKTTAAPKAAKGTKPKASTKVAE